MKRTLLFLLVVCLLVFVGYRKNSLCDCDLEISNLSEMPGFSKVWAINDKGSIVGIKDDGVVRSLVVYNLNKNIVEKTILFDEVIEDSCWLNNNGDIFGTVERPGETWAIFLVKNGQDKLIVIDLSNGFNPWISDYNDQYIVGYYRDNTGKTKPLMLDYDGKQMAYDFYGKIQVINTQGDIAGILFGEETHKVFFRSSNSDVLEILPADISKGADIPDINNNGTIIIDDNYPGFCLWSSQFGIKMISVPQINVVRTIEINDQEEIIGLATSDVYGPMIGFYWNNQNGEYHYIENNKDALAPFFSYGGQVIGCLDMEKVFCWSPNNKLCVTRKEDFDNSYCVRILQANKLGQFILKAMNDSGNDTYYACQTVKCSTN